MSDNERYSFYLYQSYFYVLVLLGLILSLTVVFYKIQGIWEIQNWVQYLLLTGVIVFSFIAAPYFSAKSVWFGIVREGIKIEGFSDRSRTINWEEIQSCMFYPELVIDRIKLTLNGNEVISIINFKWKYQQSLNTFFKELAVHREMAADRNGENKNPSKKTINKPNLKFFISLFLGIFYVSGMIEILNQEIMNSWNPILIFYFWVIPIVFFAKIFMTR